MSWERSIINSLLKTYTGTYEIKDRNGEKNYMMFLWKGTVVEWTKYELLFRTKESSKIKLWN